MGLEDHLAVKRRRELLLEVVVEPEMAVCGRPYNRSPILWDLYRSP